MSYFSGRWAGPSAVAAWMLCSSSLSRADTFDIQVDPLAFAPGEATVEVGDRLRWFFLGPVVMTSSADPGQAEAWDSGPMPGGTFFDHTFSVPGRYSYRCLLTGVEGVVVVEEVGPDSDGDALTDLHERVWYGTDPGVADSDGDGLEDGVEVRVWFSDPWVADTDGDGVTDGEEVGSGTAPTAPDSDLDGLSDGEERDLGTNPLADDSDLGGATDLEEVERGTDPLDPLDDRRELTLSGAPGASPGVLAEFAVDRASPLLPVLLLVSASEGLTEVPGCPELTVPVGPPRVVDRDRSGSRGGASLRWTPPAAAAGRELWVVAVQPDVCRLSNPLRVTVE